MKVRVCFTVDVDDDIRREINAWYGQPGLADRKAVQAWYEANGHSMDDDLSNVAGERERWAEDHPEDEVASHPGS